MSAMQNLQNMKMMGRIPYVNNPIMQNQIELSAFKQFKDEAMKALKEQEAKKMNDVEKDIQLALNNIELQIEMKKDARNEYKKKASEDAKEFVPKL
jgi:hypothetical protein